MKLQKTREIAIGAPAKKHSKFNQSMNEITAKETFKVKVKE